MSLLVPLVLRHKTRSGRSAHTALWRLLANTLFGHDAPSGAKDTLVRTDRDDGVHFRAADGLVSTERIHGGLGVSIFVRRLEMRNLSATKDGFEGEFDEELSGRGEEGS